VTLVHLWKQAFRQDYEIRQAIIDLLIDQVPADFFVDTFEPDTTTLANLFDRYRANGRIDEAKWVGLRYAGALQHDITNKSPSDPATYWQRAQATYSWLGDAEKALQCQLHAVELAPHDFDNRRILAALLGQRQRFAEAITHYEWCLRRQPDREDLRNELAEAKLQRIQHPSPAPIASKPGESRRQY
jgi:tetratricopeptide (TPR) repeat protein